jgi:hypothetical protein
MALSDWQRQHLDCYVQGAYGTGEYEILGMVPMLWSGWEADTNAVLVRLADARRVWAVMQSVDVRANEVPDVLRQRLVAYREAIEETEALLRLAGEA